MLENRNDRYGDPVKFNTREEFEECVKECFPSEPIEYSHTDSDGVVYYEGPYGAEPTLYPVEVL